VAVLTIADDERTLATTAAERITRLIEDSIREREHAIVSLTGGSTPRTLYRALADATQPWRARIDWSRVHLTWGDERHVPPDHPESNFGMANAALVSHVPIPRSRVHRMRGELPDAREAARQYEAELDAAFSAARYSDRTFDLMLLGLGEDAHIASIFPGSPLLGQLSFPVPASRFQVPGVHGSGFEVPERSQFAVRGSEPGTGNARNEEPREPATRNRGNPEPGTRNAERDSVAAVWAAHLNAWRITLTPAAILNSRSIVMIVAGAVKADAVWWALEGPEEADRHPAQILRRAQDRVDWIIDRPAAGRLPDAPRA
jgi:6-phosphogluconolactonase